MTPADAATHIAMRLVLATGQRPKEIAHLRRDRLSLDGLHPTMTVPKETAKNSTEHVVPLSRLAIGLVKEAIGIADRAAETRAKRNGTDVVTSDWVFPAPGGETPLDPHSFAVALHRARDAKAQTLFGLKDVQLYDARKTLATFLGNAGHPDQFVGLLLNHLAAKSGSVTGRHYNHAKYLDQKRAMMAEWARHLEKVLGIAVEPEASNVVAIGQGARHAV